MAKNIVRFTRNHEIEHPATTLESRIGDETFHIADIPASTTRHTIGQECLFKNKKDALRFLKAIGDAAVLVPR